jgi:single-stranded-DNA-specific exonuclease
LYAALLACSEHLVQFGGHRAAAGMTLQPDALDGFRTAFDAYCRAHLKEDQRTPTLRIQTEVKLSELSLRTELLLGRMAPFGMQNEPIVWGVRGVHLLWARPVGADSTHLKAVLEDPETGARLDWIGFGLGGWLDAALAPNALFDAAFVLERNDYQGVARLQARGLDLRLHAAD